VAWRRSTVANLVKTFLAPVSFGFVSGAVAFAFGMHSLSAVLVVTFSAFVLYTIAFEFHRGATARIAMVGESYGRALLRLIEKNQRRYGGYVVHLGVVFMFIGVTMSSVYRVEELHTVDPGESFTVGEFTMTYNSLTDLSDDHVARLAANLDISRDGEQIGELAPEKRFYRRPEQPATEVDYRSTLSEDLYVILGSVGENQTTATFQVYVNPLVAWLWIGGIVLVLGTFVCVVPIPKRATRRATASDNVRSGERA
jgi:cytochrome c-type biogenesis protein CcmF